MKPELKTRPTDASVESFIASITDEVMQQDARTVWRIMEKATGEKPVMWGPAIIGFGSRQLKYASGRELDWPIIAFSPRKQNLTLYIMDGHHPYDTLLAKLGKHSTSKACLYIKRLSDINLDVLTELINTSAKVHH
jgi:hypothetical protein